MKNNRFIALFISLIMVMSLLCSCADSAGVDDYNWVPEVIVKLEYDLYIITDSPATEEAAAAMKTVNSKINQYIEGKLDSIVNIHYVQADSYDETIQSLVSSTSRSSAVASPASRQKGGTIILITGEKMHDDLVNEGKLVDLKPFLDTKSFGSLNIQITKTLLEAAGVTDESGNSRLYCIPNDHPIGEYEYTVINRRLAEGVLNFSAQSELLEMHIENGVPNEEAAELIAAAEASMSLLGIESVDQIIRAEKGAYEDKARFEAEGYICNVTKYPMATSSDALSSGFGILKAQDIFYNGELLISASDCERRAMEIIYYINADKTVRNLLQYGVEHTNYVLDENDYVRPFENNAYIMNPLYTGDMFNILYSDIWTKEMAKNAEMQNSQAVSEK